jgi:N-acetylglucosamine-6-phosphate deacetylase
MIVLAGADLVLADRVQRGGSIVIDGGRIVALETGTSDSPADERVDHRGRYVVPGFIDIHVHGVDGHDTLGHDDDVAAMARRLPRYGVTAFCPTTVACAPATLRGLLAQVAHARRHPDLHAARVLPAHLESNFISAEYRGAQPMTCLRCPDAVVPDGTFSGLDILHVMTTHAAAVGIVTLAPEVPGVLDVIPGLVAAGHRVSLGHSGATYDVALAAIEAGARHVTHLFNRMSPMDHRAPGLVGAALSRDEVTVEIIGDGQHVHPAAWRAALAAKSPAGVAAISDGTSLSGTAAVGEGALGGRRVRAVNGVARLDDGTMAGSIATMDVVFRTLVTRMGLSLPVAAAVCASTPARAIGETATGSLTIGSRADLVVLDAHLHVVETWVGGAPVYRAGATA